MIKKIDFSSTGDMGKVLEAVQELCEFQALEEGVERLARDVFSTMRINDPMRPSGMDAVKLGWMLSERAKGNRPKNVSHDTI